ncbi:MAG: hypothetical protein II425_03385, partial [Oscillospiraceae bacterium]|nr:hypothetical protein [Oscillospiraceae bacterium]
AVQEATIIHDSVLSLQYSFRKSCRRNENENKKTEERRIQSKNPATFVTGFLLWWERQDLNL